MSSYYMNPYNQLSLRLLQTLLSDEIICSRRREMDYVKNENVKAEPDKKVKRDDFVLVRAPKRMNACIKQGKAASPV